MLQVFPVPYTLLRCILADSNVELAHLEWFAALPRSATSLRPPKILMFLYVGIFANQQTESSGPTSGHGTATADGNGLCSFSVRPALHGQ